MNIQQLEPLCWCPLVVEQLSLLTMNGHRAIPHLTELGIILLDLIISSVVYSLRDPKFLSSIPSAVSGTHFQGVLHWDKIAIQCFTDILCHSKYYQSVMNNTCRLNQSFQITYLFVYLNSYLPLIFTFADCLHHRLLCLTDSEICDISSEANYNSNDYRHQQPINNNSEPSRGGCGFRADELLQVGARLRDLMLGLIDLSHPDQVPKQTRCNLQTDTHCVESMEQPNYGAVLRRIEQWVEIADLGSSPIGDLMMRNYTQWVKHFLK